MVELPSTIAPNKRKKSSGNKRLARTSAPTKETKYFRTDEEYNKYRSTVMKLLSSLKCQDLQFLQSRPLRSLHETLEHYKLVKFVCYNESCHPRLVKMFFSNLGVFPGKLSCYVLNKRIVLDVQTLADLFDMDSTPPWTLAKDYPKYSQEATIRLLFPNAWSNNPLVKFSQLDYLLKIGCYTLLFQDASFPSHPTLQA